MQSDASAAGSEAPVDVDSETPGSRRPRSRRHWYRLALVATLALILGVLAMMPLALGSMESVLGRGPDPLYDLVTGEVVTPALAETADTAVTYFNVGMVDLDEDAGEITLAVSGNRNCKESCWPLSFTFVALDNDADQRRGLPPSATLSIDPNQRVFSQSVQLPVSGQTSLYPFDTYRLWLGVAGVVTPADSGPVDVTQENLVDHAVFTLQNRLSTMLMDPPRPIPLEEVSAPTDPFAFFAVQSLEFHRPAYLRILAVVLVVLIAISAELALFMRGLGELTLGIGGLILGVWGVRSVLMPQSFSTSTAVDLALSWVILLLLLGLAIRAALFFHRQSEFSWPRRGPGGRNGPGPPR
jgi:hypothetical protein